MIIINTKSIVVSRRINSNKFEMKETDSTTASTSSYLFILNLARRISTKAINNK